MEKESKLVPKEFADFEEANFKELLLHIRKDVILSKPYKEREMSVRHLLLFGKYKNKTFGQVLKEDKQYLKWLKNNDICKFDKELEKLIK